LNQNNKILSIILMKLSHGGDALRLHELLVYVIMS